MDTITRPGIQEDTSTRDELEPLYHLILLDDNHHTYQYVITMLADLFGYSPEKGYAIACVVDSQGQAILMTGPREEAERKQEQVHSYGPDPLMAISQGSMSAIIEPAE
ncbi:MAG: ATP-dependent Clp protease adaptor ClpS [Dehalococcoidia bacterium]